MMEWNRGPVLQARKVAFIKHCAFRDDGALGVWIVELLALVVWWVAKKDTLLHMRSQRTMLILLHMLLNIVL